MSRNTVGNYDPLEYSFSRKRPLRCTSLHHTILLTSHEEELGSPMSTTTYISNSPQGYPIGISQVQNDQEAIIQHETENSSSDEDKTMSNIQENPIDIAERIKLNNSKMNTKDTFNIHKTGYLFSKSHETEMYKDSESQRRTFIRNEMEGFSQKQFYDAEQLAAPYIQSDPIKRFVTRNKSLLPKPKMVQRIIASLLEESSPVESEIKNEALLSKILRKSEYIDNYMNFYNVVKEKKSDDMIEDSLVTTPVHENSHCIKEAWDLSPNKKGLYACQSKSVIDWTTKDDSMLSPSIRNSIQNGKTSKRKVNCDERFEAYLSFKRRAVSPSLGSSSPTFMSNSSPLSAKRSIFPMQDTNDGLMKMSLQ